MFTRAKVPCRISENLTGELWTKLVWNCALNALSALGKVTYGEIIASADAKILLEGTVYEVLAVARAAGIQPHHARRLQMLLAALETAQAREDMKVPGFAFILLRGQTAVAGRCR